MWLPREREWDGGGRGSEAKCGGPPAFNGQINYNGPSKGAERPKKEEENQKLVTPPRECFQKERVANSVKGC